MADLKPAAAFTGFQGLDLEALPSPCYVVDAMLLRKNLEVIADAQERGGGTILLALKGFAMWSTFPIIREYLRGTTASSLNEVRLGREEFGGETHAYAPAYREDEWDGYKQYADHLVFNSMSQWAQFRDRRGSLSCGVRINPRHSEVKTALYDPCAPKSRLGVTRDQFDVSLIEGLEGLHFHTLCELNSDALERTLVAVEDQFGEFIPRMKWINFGGGHHISRLDYDVELLVRLVKSFREKYGVQVYLEPGEAIALNTGILVATVLDIVENVMPIAILDTSVTAHMPDVLEMPYRPVIVGGGSPGHYAHTYRLGGLTCLAGDVIGDWSFEKPLKPGDKLVFQDMAHYTMVKNTTFNGVNLPSIALHDSDGGETRVVREFGYEDYRGRLS
jgi:carboxynorspermidine decarboxylase